MSYVSIKMLQYYRQSKYQISKTFYIISVVHQVSLFMEFSRQEYQSGLPFPSPGDLLDQPRYQTLGSCFGRQILYHLSQQGSLYYLRNSKELHLLSAYPSLVAQTIKNLPAMQETLNPTPGSTPGLGRSPGEGNGNSLQYSCLVNSVNRGARWAIVHGVAKSLTQLSD